MAFTDPLGPRPRSGRRALLVRLAALALLLPAWAGAAGADRLGSRPGRPEARAPDLRGLSRIYFPPTPPRLRAPTAPLSSLVLGHPAPAGLAPFVNEPFYAPLSTRLDEKKLTGQQAQKLEAYRQAKAALLHALRQRLAAVEREDPSTREQLLAAFAREQTPRLVELEAQAEALREELIRGRDNWNAYRPWRLGDTQFRTKEVAMAAQFQVMRAAAFYQKGLSPAQRRLLREIAMELETFDRLPVAGGELSGDANPLFYFSPETSRLRLPSTLTPELAELIADYEERKSSLKQELRDLIYKEDDAFLAVIRQRRIEALAQRQAPALAELERLAEAIRRLLARTAYPPPPPSLPPLAPELANRLAAYLEERARLPFRVLDVLQEVQAIAPLRQIGMQRSEQGQYELFIVLAPEADKKATQQRIDTALESFNHRHQARVETLAAEFDAIRREVGWIGNPDSTAGSWAIERRIQEFAEAYLQQRLHEDYRDYQTAVLEPGLSPEQRRLLYDGALEHLALPLPGGNYQPAEY